MKLNADIVYFGDSTTNWAVGSDANQESMPGLLQRLLPHKRIAKITYSSYQPDVYEAYSKYMSRKGYRPDYVVIPVNLRSFSPEWDRQPLWQFEKEKITLAIKDTWVMKFYHQLEVFKFFEPRITRFDYENTDVFQGDVKIGKVRDFDNPDYQRFSEKNLQQKLRFRYLYPLSPKNRKLKSLLSAVRVLKSQGVVPVVYITPLDWQAIQKSLGPAALSRIENNVSVLRDSLSEAGVPVLDLCQSLPSSEFSWPEDGQGPHYPNEHLRLRGRMFVVKSLADNTQLIKSKL